MLGVVCTSGASSTTVIVSSTEVWLIWTSRVRCDATLSRTSSTVTVAKPESSAFTV